MDSLVRDGACSLPRCDAGDIGLPDGVRYRYDMVTTRSNCSAGARLVDPFTGVGGQKTMEKTLHVEGSCGFANDAFPTRQTETFVGSYKAHCDVQPQAGGSTALEVSVIEFDSVNHGRGHGRAYVAGARVTCDFDFDIELSRL